MRAMLRKSIFNAAMATTKEVGKQIHRGSVAVALMNVFVSAGKFAERAIFIFCDSRGERKKRGGEAILRG